MIPEEKFIEIFATLPTMRISGQNFKPVFDFGSQEDLLYRINQKNKADVVKYPLVYLETSITATGRDKKIIKLKLILATLSNGEISNNERLELTFKPTLYPLLENVKKALSHSGITRMLNQEKNKETNFFKYGDGKNENFSSDIWDALLFECEIEMKNCPLRNINY